MLARAILLLPLLLGSALHAQTTAQRTGLDRLRDSVAAVADADGLRAALRNSGSDRDNLTRLRRSVIALRVGELTGERAALDEALRSADDVTHAEPGWPYAWFFRGMTKLALGDRGFAPKALGGQAEGERYYGAFVRDATHALSLDPALPPLVAALTPIMTAEGDREQPPAFLDAIRLGLQRGLVDARGHLILARAARTARDDSTALDELSTFERSGGDAGVAALERARTLAGLGRPRDALAEYLRGAGMASAEARAFYRRDLEWVAEPQDLLAYDSVDAASVRPWLEHFWAIHGAESLRSGDERIAEHLRRWAYVYRYFRVVDPERRVDLRQVRVENLGACQYPMEMSLDDYTMFRPDRLDDHRSRERLLDHRAAVYMRHGEPWRRVGTPAPASSGPDEAGPRGEETDDVLSAHDVANGIARDSVHSVVPDVWLYWFADRPRLFYFGSSQALGPGPTTLYTHVPYESSLLYLLGSVDPVFTKAANRVVIQEISPSRAAPLQCTVAIQDLVAHTWADVTAGAENDSYTLLFRHPLGGIMQSFVIGEPDLGTGRVLLAYAIPRAALSTAAPRAELRASAVDARRSMSVFADTTVAFAPAGPADSAGFASGMLELPVPAGRYTVRFAVSRPSAEAGTVLTRHDALLGDGRPGLSDIIPTVNVGGAVWRSGAGAVRINTLGGYREGGSASVYYEVYGLDPGTTYRTRVALQQYGARRPHGVTLAFTEPVSASRMSVRREISLAGLRPGQYELAVTVENAATGNRATRKQLINVMRRQ